MMSPSLTTKQLVYLRSRAHRLDPRVALGKEGPGSGFRRQLDEALGRDELVKIRLGRRIEVDLQQLAESFQAVLVQRVGRTATLYRPADEPGIQLPRP